AEAGLRLRIVVDDLGAFATLCPAIDPGKGLQELGAWTIVRWESPGETALALFRADRPRAVLECFACGRPAWLEEILFDPADLLPRRVFNIEHLTAESWAEDFHLLTAATRSSLVRKLFFMPGFTPGTGGLVIDRRFREARERCLDPVGRAAERRSLAARLGARLGGELGAPGTAERFWTAVFSYERDYGRIVADLAELSRDRPILALVAAGRSREPFMAAWLAAGEPFPAASLPFLPQEDWDELLLACDFSIVRGEESLARAALAGRPFLWHAYLQDENHQMVKVRSLLELLRPHFEAEAFGALERLWLAFNDRRKDEASTGGAEELLPVLRLADSLLQGFASFAERVAAHGDLATRLLALLRENPP
ncbi:MAG: elongation factor P maturation arginine rhamnosyltransferase EarP, partial [Spirochaetaceae bacterium]|nr:elongation factor P maturation arginine rhamnosyltransferase EarP [Spirochaetaceae bacterium]